MNAIDIPRTLGVVIESWDIAERGVRERISTHAPGLDETEITSRFHEDFARSLEDANGARRIETAFLKDLVAASLYEGFSESDLRRIARGLIAQATLHPGETERRTGGDLGLVIVRPVVARGYGNLNVSRRHRQGLLCQAKLKRHGRRHWGRLTSNQERVLPGRIPYLALLLYQYLDRIAHNLEPFAWQVCSGHSLIDLKAWLKDGSFPQLSGSKEILLALGTNKIGTSDAGILDTVIAPQISRYLEVRIDWPDDGPPGASVQVVSKSHSREGERVVVYAR